MPNIAAARPVAGQPIETAWGQQVHDAIEAQTTQTGVVNVPSPAAITATYALTFPVPFVAPPAVVCSTSPQYSSGHVIVAVGGLTNAGCTLYLERTNGAAIDTITAVTWIAVGQTAT